MKSLENKVAIVTGGARGLGAAICKSLCECGAVIIPADVREDLLQKTVDELRSNGAKIKALALDICDPVQVEKAVQKIRDEYGRIDVLVNNAGADKTVPIEELSVADWNHVLSVNLTGPFLASKFVLPIMKAQGVGHIVNIASTAAKRAWANAAAYHASKWGLVGFSHALHVEARPYNVKVTAVIAGGMRTPFLLDRFPDINAENLQDPQNVADTIRFILSQPAETVIPEVMVLPMRETSWP